MDSTLEHLDFELGRILGLIEGEGYFSIGIHRGRSGGFTVGPIFGISLVEEHAVLEEIANSFRFYGVKGAVFANRRGRNNHEGRWKDQWKFQTHGISDALRLVELLRPLKWMTKKRRTFDVWCEVVERISKGGHLNRDGFIEITRLWDGAGTTKGHTRKYTAAYFENLWKEPWETRPGKRIPPSVEVLREMYLVKKMSVRQMYRELDCGHGTVYRWLEKAGIEMREKSESVRLGRRARARNEEVRATLERELGLSLL